MSTPRILLASILFAAALLHVVRPEAFNPAIPFEPKLAINMLVGAWELVLAVGLLRSQSRDAAAKATALWFLALVPIHVYVSLNAIPMFGISHPGLLWGRTIFQGFLFFWALSLQEKGWIISQRWSDVLFLHYEVDADFLQSKVPYPLDLYQGKAVVSIVPFTMSHIRFPFLPSIPGLSKLFELNLRTYVRVNGTPAVYFFTLDSNHLPGVLVARSAFSLPYRWKKMKLVIGEFYDFLSDSLRLKAKIDGPAKASDFDRWATERYALATRRGKRDLIGFVEHVPWKLWEATIVSIDDEFSNLLGDKLQRQNFLGASYAKTLDVRFRPFRDLKLKRQR